MKYLYRANRDQHESMMAHLPSTPLKQARKTAPNDIENKIDIDKKEADDADDDDKDNDANNEELIYLANVIAKGLLSSRKIVSFGFKKYSLTLFTRYSSRIG